MSIGEVQKNMRRALLGKLLYSLGNGLFMMVILLIFTYLLLHSLTVYFFLKYTLIPIALCCFLYALALFVFLRFIKSKRWIKPFVLGFFVFTFFFLGYQIAFDARSEFGTTWLPSEVFWELFVTKGKGIYILLVALLVQLLFFNFLSKTKP